METETASVFRCFLLAVVVCFGVGTCTYRSIHESSLSAECGTHTTEFDGGLTDG